MFEDEAGNAVSPWTSIMGRVWNIPANEDADGPQPDVKQFNPASPAPYLDQVQGYAQRVASEAGIPTTYFGIQTANPASADAIRAAESRLVKRAERRQASFGRSWLEVGRLALMVRDGDAARRSTTRRSRRSGATRRPRPAPPRPMRPRS